MRKICKYILETADMQTLQIPKLNGAKTFKEQVLKIDVQNNMPCLWCLVDVEEEQQEILIQTVGTENPMPLFTKDDYLGSYMLYNGELCFHVFVNNYIYNE